MAKAAAVPARGKKAIVRANFTGVDSGGITVPEGEYIAKVKIVKLEESSGGNDYLAWELKVRDGKHVNKTLYHNTSLSTQSLWATKRWLETLGVEVPDGEMDMDLEEYVDMEIGVIVEHETYKGRVKARIVDCFPAEGEAEGTEAQDEATEITEDQVNEMDKSELKALVKERGLDVELTGSLSSQRKQVIEALAEAGADETSKGDDAAAEVPTADEIGEMGKAALAKLVEEHELDVELTGATSAQRRQVIKALADKAKASPKTAAGKKAKARVKASEVTAATEEDLTEIIEKYELDVDLDAFATLRKKRGAVTEALEGIDQLEDDE